MPGTMGTQWLKKWSLMELTIYVGNKYSFACLITHYKLMRALKEISIVQNFDHPQLEDFTLEMGGVRG